MAWKETFFPEKVEAGSTEAVATAYGDRVCKVAQADRAVEFFSDGLWEAGLHFAEGRKSELPLFDQEKEKYFIKFD